jgi:hypothetical protein
MRTKKITTPEVVVVQKTPSELIADKTKTLLEQAAAVNTDSIASLATWLDSGAVELGKLVGDVKAIKKDILKSDAKSKVKADMYIVTTPLIPCKVKVSDIRSAFNLHTKRLRNIEAMCNTLNGVKKPRATKAKKKGGNK